MNELERIIQKYPNKPWCWGHNGISLNPNITLEWLEKYSKRNILIIIYLKN